MGVWERKVFKYLPVLQDAERAELRAILPHQRCTCVKPDEGIASNERVACEPGVMPCVEHHKHPVFLHCVCTKGLCACVCVERGRAWW